MFALLRRLNLVYFRWYGCLIPSIYTGLTRNDPSTQYTPAILTPSILSSAHRRAFQPYTFTRSSNIWPSRIALLAYERALELEAQIDELSDNALTPSRARSRARSVTSHLSSISQFTVKLEPGIARENELGEDSTVKESLRAHNARLVVPIFEIAYAEWRALGEGNSCPRPRGLERFDRGIVLAPSVSTHTERVLFDRSRSHAHCAERRRGSWRPQGLRPRTRGP